MLPPARLADPDVQISASVFTVKLLAAVYRWTIRLLAVGGASGTHSVDPSGADVDDPPTRQPFLQILTT